MTLLSETRHISCPDAFNVRDLGGYVTGDGRRVRWRVLYRADGLHRVTPASAAVLGQLGWRTVLDLRTVGEVSLGSYRGDGVEVVHLPVLHRTWDEDGIGPASSPVEFLVARYLAMLEQGAAAIGAAVEIIASPNRAPLVFHCAAGKDRTGVVAGLVLSLLGVPDPTVAEDYGLSAGAMAKIRHRDGSEPHRRSLLVDQPAVFHACPPRAMRTFLDEVRVRFGSVEGYVLHTGVAAATVARLRDVMLGP